MSKTILFVDDDADDRDVLADVLQQVSTQVNAVFAENGLKAIEYLSASSQLPCLIVLDLNMPVLDGKETFKKIKNELNLGSVPVIIFTSSHNPNDRNLFHSLGIEYITKPDDFSHLNKIVGHMVNVCSGNC
jgi:CheY-like chemotaxis protein